MNFKKFIIKQAHVKLNVKYENGVKDTSKLGYQLGDISEKKLDGSKWYELKRNDPRLNAHNKKYDDYNIMFVSLNRKLCVIDTDGEEEYNIIHDYLENICKYKMIDNNVTKSSYNFEVKDTDYKRHFWFEIDNDESYTNILGSKYGLKFDILFDKVFEHKQNYKIDNFNLMCIGKDEITQLLKHLDKKFNTDFCGDFINSNTIETGINNESNKDVNELRDYIECLKPNRYEYINWRNVGFALHNAVGQYDEDDLINLYNEWSSRDKRVGKYKGLKEILSTWRNIKTISNGITLKSFYMWCKEDNEDLYNKLVKKYSKNNETYNNDIWQVLEDMNHSDMAKLYYKLNPNKYVYSTSLGWYEYNNNNVLISYSKVIPPSLLSDTTNKLQNYIIEERNKIKPPIKDSKMSNDEYNKKLYYYDNCMKLAKKGYINVGNSSYVKNIIDYLSNLYNVDRLETLLDANEKLLPFDNMLFDYDKCIFRNIEPTDYITKTTRYDLPTKSSQDFEFISKLLYSIFENNDVVEYWLATTGLSLFGNKLESLYIHTGSGGNGKGLLSSILVKGLGDFIYCADNTFLTSVFRSGQANPTLAKCQGVRYLLVSEPDDGSDDVKFNVDFIKMLTGGDIVTTRDLFKSNISYKPQFTPFVQCNNKPKLGKIDNGIKRRLKIINYPLKFVDNPAKANERPIDYSLKDKVNNGIYKQFILLLIEKAVEYKNKRVIQPFDVENETREYFDDNDPVKGWLANHCQITDNVIDQVKTSDLYNKYISSGSNKLSIVKFIEYMKQNEINIISKKGYKFFTNIKVIDTEVSN